MKILGTNFLGHDSAVFLLDTGRKEVFAMSTERVTRLKHDDRDIVPLLAECGFEGVEHAGHGFAERDTGDGGAIPAPSARQLQLSRLNRQVFRPRYAADLEMGTAQKAGRLLRALATEPGCTLRYLALRTRNGFGAGVPLDDDGFREHIRRTLAEHRIHPKTVSLFDHHFCHAASAYSFSPFAPDRRALVLTLDGFGDGYFSKAFVFEGAGQRLVASSAASPIDAGGEREFASIGLIYHHFMLALGFSDEGKVEALAAYGEPDPQLYRALRDCVRVDAGGFRFDPAGTPRFYDIAGLKKTAARVGERGFAASVQRWLEDIVVEHLNALHGVHGGDNLCLAGGVFANVILNLNIHERTPYRNLYVFPAMGDEGVAAGSAILSARQAGADISWLPGLRMPYFGNRITPAEVEQALRRFPRLRAERIAGSWEDRAAQAVSEGMIIAVVQGRMEFGPRALGNRSILANPATKEMRDRINAEIKRRPAFQPLCPSVLEEERERLFEASFSHKLMAIAFRMREEFRGRLPSAVHVDGTARAQFVEVQDNPSFHRLLSEVKRRTGFGVVLNTSFNLHGRTIVRTAEDALTDFVDCNLDELYLEGLRIVRPE